MTVTIKDHEVWRLRVVKEDEQPLSKFMDNDNISENLIKKKILEPFNNLTLDRCVYYNFDKKKPCGQVNSLRLSSEGKLFIDAVINKYSLFEKNKIDNNDIKSNISIGPSYSFELDCNSPNEGIVFETLVFISGFEFGGFGVRFSDEITKKIKQ